MPKFSSFRRNILVFFVALALTGGLGTAQTPAAAPQSPATIYLIRHAEKLTDKRPDLAPEGFRRAALIPNLFLPPAGDPARRADEARFPLRDGAQQEQQSSIRDRYAAVVRAE